jgi:hypothetical protein
MDKGVSAPVQDFYGPSRTAASLENRPSDTRATATERVKCSAALLTATQPESLPRGSSSIRGTNPLQCKAITDSLIDEPSQPLRECDAGIARGERRKLRKAFRDLVGARQ